MPYEIPALLTDPHRIALLLAIAGAAAAIAATVAPWLSPRSARAPDQGGWRRARAHPRSGAGEAGCRRQTVGGADEAEPPRQAAGRTSRPPALARRRDRQEAAGDGGLPGPGSRIRLSHLPYGRADRLFPGHPRLRIFRPQVGPAVLASSSARRSRRPISASRRRRCSSGTRSSSARRRSSAPIPTRSTCS